MTFEALFDASYERVIKIKKDDVDFFGAFYENFLSCSPHIAARFHKTDMVKQRGMLKKSFYSLMVFYVTNSLDNSLERIAESHNAKNLNIPPAMYDLWLESLIKTASEWDPLFDDDTELGWRLVMSSGITYMKYKYSKT